MALSTLTPITAGLLRLRTNPLPRLNHARQFRKSTKIRDVKFAAPTVQEPFFWPTLTPQCARSQTAGPTSHWSLE